MDGRTAVRKPAAFGPGASGGFPLSPDRPTV